MEQIEILNNWKKFAEEYNFDLKEKIWDEKQKEFSNFWENRIMDESSPELKEEEIDKIIQILDRNGKGNTKEHEAVAKAMIAQGAWRRMFIEIRANKKLKDVLNKIFTSKEDEMIGSEINNLYKINEGRKNFLTGNNGNAINDMMFAFNPKKYIAVVSLNHRNKIIDYFGFQKAPNFDEDSPGKKIVLSNKSIINGFSSLGINFKFPRAISDFLYTTLKNYWNKKEKGEEEADDDSIEEPNLGISEEKIEQLKEEDYQKLIHNNFKKIFPDLEYVDEDYQNQHLGHYVTTESKIMDFLCKDKKGNFVVIELKIKGADEALGQVCRYMGWVKENLCENSQKVRGIIISERADNQLDYAIKVVPEVTFKRMWLEVKIKEWEK